MLNEPHYPSKWSAALVFVVIILLIGGVFVWAFYLNLGTVVVKADRGFTLQAGGESYDCSQGSCTVSLVPKSYELVAQATGYYDESFDLEVRRWHDVEKELVFRLIPYLTVYADEALPAEAEPLLRFVAGEGGKQQLYMKDETGERLVTTFDSLQDPVVQAGGEKAVVVDQGRVFFVQLRDGRKLRRFDDTVIVHDALMSDGGKRVLLFITMKGIDQIWLWYEETSELVPLDFYEPPEFIQWQPGVDHRIFIVTDQLRDETQESFIDEILETAGPVPDGGALALFQYNLDMGKAQLIAEFEERDPQRLLRRGDRYFVEFEGAEYQELVVQ